MWFYQFFTGLLGDSLILKNTVAEEDDGIRLSRSTDSLMVSRYNLAGGIYEKLYYNPANGLFDSTTTVGLNTYKSLGTYLTDALAGVAALTLFTETANERYLLGRLRLCPRTCAAGLIAGAQNLRCSINGTSLTGGVITVGFGDLDADADMGTDITSTPITALNQVEVGDTVTLDLVAGGTGFTAAQLAMFEVIAYITKN